MSIKNFGEACKRIFESVKTLTGEVKVSTDGNLQDQISAIINGTKTAGEASKWSTARNINGMSVDGTVNRTNYGTCSTVAGTAAKTVACTGFALVTGAEITVKFTVTNTASNPTLNVNGTGAKAIYYRGSAISAGYLAANRIYTFRYNGSQWELVGDINVDTNTTYTVATQSKDGLQSAADKKKIDGIEDGANKTTVDSEFSTGSTNPVQNKVISAFLNSIIDGTKIVGASKKLETARNLLVNLASTDKALLDGSADKNLGVTGTLPIANGGTGATNAATARSNLGITPANIEAVPTDSKSKYNFTNKGLNTINIDTDNDYNYVTAVSIDKYGTRPIAWSNILNLYTEHFISQIGISCIDVEGAITRMFLRDKYAKSSNSSFKEWTEVLTTANHNKPYGTYTGNGSATERQITVGGTGKILAIYNGEQIGLVYSQGAIVFNVNNGTVANYTGNKVKFNGGILTLAISDFMFNGNGSTINYILL